MLTKITQKLRPLPAKNTNRGFSLPELLIGALMTGLVVAGAGWGMVSMTTANTATAAEGERRTELNRAQEFMALEARQAERIFRDASEVEVLSFFDPPSAEVDTDTVQRILMLKMPGVATPVLYYIAEPAADNTTWRGPNVVYRWGPAFDINGDYTNSDAPEDWEHEPLIDLIDNTASATNCDDGWTANPSNGATGFYACVDPTGKLAEINYAGRINYALEQTDSYSASSKAFARPSDLSFGGSGPGFVTSDGVITITGRSTMAVEVLGGDITCGAGGPVVPTQGTLNFTLGDQTTHETFTGTAQSIDVGTVNPGTTLTVTGKAQGASSSGSCKNYQFTAESDEDHGTQVLVLMDGDTPPLFSPFGGQRPIDTFLQDYIDPDTGKVTIAPNQAIILYELGTTNDKSSAYDMQDLVVLATVTPTNY